MTSLVDRYVYTALRRVPEPQRADIDRELRASIDDAVDARVDAGESREAAVEAALTDLGDPDKLADRYADRPAYLIGPALYTPWRKLTVTLLSTVLPLVVAVVVVVQLFDDPKIGDVIGAAVSTILNVGIQMVFWTTLVFYIIERTGAGRASLRTTWSLKDLPRYQPEGMTTPQAAAGIVWSVMLIAALVLQQFTISDVPVLDPANWSFWWPFLIVAFALRGAYTVWVWRLGTWNRTVSIVNAIVHLLSTVPLVWLLLTDRFFNPEFHHFADLGAGDVKGWLSTAIAAVLILGTAWDIIDVTIRGERLRRGLPVKVPGTGGTYNSGA
jgi:hypothetical protein